MSLYFLKSTKKNPTLILLDKNTLFICKIKLKIINTLKTDVNKKIILRL